MEFAVLGTGVVGKTLAARLASIGHDVAMGTRDPAAALARTNPGANGEVPLSDFLVMHRTIRLRTFAAAAQHGQIVINATSGGASIEALTLAGAENLDRKVLIDVANPLDFSGGFPPTLSISNTDSLGETIQRAFPGARVVKALNTVHAALMVHPERLVGGDHTLFLCGDDGEAKATVTRLLREDFGWTDILDLGGLSMARGTEMYLALWVRLYGALRTPMFSVKVVR